MGYLFALFLLCAPAFAAEPCVTSTPECRARLDVAGKKVPYFRTYSFDAREDEVTSAIVVIHGVLRNPGEYFANMVEAARRAGRLRDTLVVAPHFQEIDDKPGSDELWWKSGWKQGDDSVSPGPSASTFDFLDELVRKISDGKRFPKLKRIVVTGHSAGGQFESRYAAGTSVETELHGVTVVHLIANPSTYLYLNGLRKKEGRFETPAPGCDDYDEYLYGMEKRNRYMSRSSAAELAENLRRKDITIFIGREDTGTDYLDMSCGANLQGKNRYERGVIYHDYLSTQFAPPRLRLVVVPGVGHDNGLMYGSKEGVALLFPAN